MASTARIAQICVRIVLPIVKPSIAVTCVEDLYSKQALVSFAKIYTHGENDYNRSDDDVGMSDDCADQLPTAVLESRLMALENAKVTLQHQLHDVEKQIAHHKGVLHTRELKRYGEELDVMEKIVSSYKGDKHFFNEMIAEAHRLEKSFVYLFKGLEKVYMEVEMSEKSIYDNYPPALEQRLKSMNCTLIMLWDV